MQELLAQAFGYVWGVWRHRWIALAIAWLIAIAGWIVVWRMPVAYVATAEVFVDTNTVLRPLLRGLAITPNINQRVAMMSRTLLSRPNLEKLSRMTDLDLQATTDAEKQKVISTLRNSVGLSGVRGRSSVYKVRAKHENRAMAKRMVQSLITVFIESSLNDKRLDSTGAQSFLDEQIAEYERRLIEAEGRLARFKQQNVDVLSTGGGYYGRLQQAKESLRQAQLELQEAENRRVELQKQLDGEQPLIIGTATSPLDSRIEAMRIQLDRLLTRYTDKHPEVRQLRGLIEELESEKTRQLSSYAEGDGAASATLNSSPVYQGMRTMLTESEARVAELSVRVGEYERRVTDLESRVNSVPIVEAQLKQLDRDYNVIFDQHQTMLQRRESARLSQDVEDNAGDVTFRVIEPPFVPLRPSEPDKLMLNAGVLAVALGAGVAVALLLSLLNPIITDARTLANTAGLPLLGSVTSKLQPWERRKDTLRLASFAACGLFLVATFAGVTVAPGFL